MYGEPWHEQAYLFYETLLVIEMRIYHFFQFILCILLPMLQTSIIFAAVPDGVNSFKFSIFW